jgi:hypothetical protein
MKGRECSQWLGLRRGIRRGSGQVGDSGGVLAGSGPRRLHDGDQRDTAGSRAWSALSIASWYGVEVRLETCRAAGCFGLMKGSSICCEIKQTKDVREGTGARGRE